MGKTKDRVEEFLDTYITKQTNRKPKNIDKAVEYRFKNPYPTSGKFSSDFKDEYGIEYSLSFGNKSDKWYEEERSERLDLSSSNIPRRQYFYIKANKKTRELGMIPEPYSERTLIDKYGNKIVIMITEINIGERRATGEVFVNVINVVRKL